MFLTVKQLSKFWGLFCINIEALVLTLAFKFMAEIKCSKCGTWNKDLDYCATCSELISPILIEEEREKVREEIRQNTPPTKLDIFIEKWKNSRFFLIRAVYYILYSIGFIFFSVAGFFAWLSATPNG